MSKFTVTTIGKNDSGETVIECIGASGLRLTLTNFNTKLAVGDEVTVDPPIACRQHGVFLLDWSGEKYCPRCRPDFGPYVVTYAPPLKP